MHNFRPNLWHRCLRPGWTFLTPFANVGIDFGGPYLVRHSNLRKASHSKCYLAIFICMTTRAVHLELVSDLTTEAFLASLKRFIGRRGNPHCIFSDNATNFVGAKNKLKELVTFLNKRETTESVSNFLNSTRIEWKLIPPRSPHHGGLWEAGIKSAKYHLARMLGTQVLTFEQFATVLAQIEAVLNSRPLCALSNDPSDLSYLSPGHFLIGRTLTSYPERDMSEISNNRLKFWETCSKLRQHF